MLTKMNEQHVLLLPDETLLQILRYFHYKDIVSVSSVCSRLRTLAADDILWRWQCQHYFISTSLDNDHTWQQHFIRLYIDYGKYLSVYKQMRHAWNRLENFVKQNCPVIWHSLQEGIEENYLNSLEEKLGCQLPLDLRLSYRIHNGQIMRTKSGLMGGSMLASYLWTEHLQPIDYCENEMVIVKGKYVVVTSILDKPTIIQAISNAQGFTTGYMYFLMHTGEQKEITDFFIAGTSFLDWFCSYVDKVTENAYYIKSQYILKFYHEPSCVATTAGITVKPTSCFMPYISDLANSTYVFSYRIILEMSRDVPQDQSCQLTTRHWVIMDANGKVEYVNGDGVVGEFPIMRPGLVFDWVSCTSFPTSTGNMRGHFGFRNLITGETVDVECPCFHMAAWPSLTEADRNAIKIRRALTTVENELGMPE